MPELPEVETTISGLKPIIGSCIINVKINTPKLRIFIPKNILLIKRNVRIINFERKGKFIIFNLSNNYNIVLHLGMSGRLRLFNSSQFCKKKHDHFTIKTNTEHILVFNDPRRFGFIDYDKYEQISKRRYILNLGIDALDKFLSAAYLLSKISKKMVPIKQILLDQRVISGIGNIYACEILFNAKISPLELGKNISLTQCETLINSTKKILKKAIFFGGSSLKDYVSTDGTLGNFQKNFKVYNREGLMINGEKIIKIVQYGRSTYYCPKIQKKKNKSMLEF